MIRVAAALALAGGCADDGGPRLTSITPVSPHQGDPVELAGTRFCGAHGDCTNIAATVMLGDSAPFFDAPAVMWSATLADVDIPLDAPVGKTSLVMTVDDRSSNALEVEILPGPS